MSATSFCLITASLRKDKSVEDESRDQGQPSIDARSDNINIKCAPMAIRS